MGCQDPILLEGRRRANPGPENLNLARAAERSRLSAAPGVLNGVWLPSIQRGEALSLQSWNLESLSTSAEGLKIMFGHDGQWLAAGHTVMLTACRKGSWQSQSQGPRQMTQDHRQVITVTSGMFLSLL